MNVWIVFLGAYSDRRAAAVFDTEDRALTAADALLAMEESGNHYYPRGVEIERHKVQTVALGAGIDGGALIYADGKRYDA